MKVYLVSAINPKVTTPGGVRPYVLGLAENLNSRGHVVHLIGAGPKTESEFCEFTSVSSALPLSEYDYVRALRKWIRSNPIEDDSIVHCQRPDELWALLSHDRRPVMICTLHGDPRRGVAQRRTLGRVLYRYAERRALVAASWVVSVSRSDLKTYLGRFPWLKNKSNFIPIGIDISKFHPIDRKPDGLPESGHPPLLIFAGRLESEKRVGVILKALRNLPAPPTLWVAGDGRESSSLRRQAWGLPVRFLGTVPYSNIPALFSAADALILPSEYEGIPMVVLEALACGTPVICTRVGDLDSVVIEGRTGFFFDGTSADLARVLSLQMTQLASLRSECANSIREYSWDSIVERILGVYETARRNRNEVWAEG